MIRIGLDECVNVGPAETLVRFFALERPPIEAVFLPEVHGSGAKDDHWSDRLEAEGGWCVITGDLDRKRKSVEKRLADGPPLPLILPRKRITAVYLSGSLQQATGTERVRAIISVWPEMKIFFETASRGSRKLLTKVNAAFRLQDF